MTLRNLYDLQQIHHHCNIFYCYSVHFLSINSLSLIANTEQQTSSSSNQGKVFVMYAASLVSTFENSLGPSFQKQTGYTYIGEGRGSIQIANMIIDGQRRPDVFVSAGTIPIMKLMTIIAVVMDSGSATHLLLRNGS